MPILMYFNFYQVGQRVASGTLSDIAAMAAKPVALFISVLLPPSLSEKKLKDLYTGMQSIGNKFSCQVAGGDIVAYPKLGLILCAVGKTEQPKLRSNAKPGDYLYVTGYCGLAETGRWVLEHKLPKKDYRQAIQKHISPIPRIYEAQKLKKNINAMIDTSDGLSTDANHLAKESGVKINIFADKIPIHKETVKLSSKPAFMLALNSGEDYELLFTSPQKNLPKSVLNTRVSQVGVVEKGRGVFLIQDQTATKLNSQGYDHFRKK